MKLKKLLLGLAASALVFASCNPDDERYQVDNKVPNGVSAIHVMNDLSQYWTPQLGDTESGSISGYLDYEAKGQFMTQSLGNPEAMKSLLPGVNVLNVFVNMGYGKAYSDDDKAVYDLMLSSGGGLGIFAMGEGNALAAPNALAEKYGFSFEAGPVGDALDGGVKAYNKGFFLNLKDQSKWEVLVKAGGKPVIAVAPKGSGYVLASGIDIFGTEKLAANVDVFQKAIEKISSKKPGLVSTEKIRPTLTRKTDITVAGTKLTVNKYLVDDANTFKSFDEKVVNALEEVMGTTKGMTSDLAINLTLSDYAGDITNGKMNLGLFYGGFPADQTKMTVRLAELLHKYWTLPKQEQVEFEAFSKYVAYKVAEKLGDANATAEIARLIKVAKADTKYREYDPISMTEDQRKKYSMDLRQGKFFFMMDSLQKKYTEVDVLQKYYETKRSSVPTFESFQYTPHDFAWVMGKALGDDKFLSNTKLAMGYSFVSEKIRNPLAYDRVILDRLGWEAYSAQSYHGDPASKMLDGDKGSYWNCTWGGDAHAFPHFVEIDMKKEHKILGFRYITKLNTRWGEDQIMFMDVFVSKNKSDWIKVGEYSNPTGKWTDQWQEIFAEQYIKARYIKLQVNNTARNGNPNHSESCMAEFEVYSDGKTR